MDIAHESRGLRLLPRPTHIAPPGPRDVRIAQALHSALTASRSALTDRPIPRNPSARPKTFDEILALLSEQGRSRVFRTLKSEGWIDEQTLGQVVARWIHGVGREEPAVNRPREPLRGERSRAPIQSE